MTGSCTDIKGSNSIIRVTEESAFGVYNGDATKYYNIPFNTFGLAYSRNEVESDTIKSGRAPSAKALGDISVEGDVVVPLDDEASYIFLKGVFGKVSSKSVNGKFEHKFEINNSCLPSFAFEKSFNGISYNYLISGAKFNSLSVDFGGEGQVNATVSTMAKNELMRQKNVSNVELNIASFGINGESITLTAANPDLVEGDILTLIKEIGTVNGNKGNTLVQVTGDISNITKGSKVEINGVPYTVTITNQNNTIVLDRGLDENAVSAEIVQVDFSTKIASIQDETLTLVKVVPVAYRDADKASLFKTDINEFPTSTNFEHGEVNITSQDGTVALGLVESVNFNFTNNIEGTRYINSKGSYGKLSEGKVSITAEMTMTFDAENAQMMEDAKVGKLFDLSIKLINSAGNELEIYLPSGKLTPAGPSIEGPSAITVSVSYSPFGEGIYAVLRNNKGDYVF